MTRDESRSYIETAVLDNLKMNLTSPVFKFSHDEVMDMIASSKAALTEHLKPKLPNDLVIETITDKIHPMVYLLDALDNGDIIKCIDSNIEHHFIMPPGKSSQIRLLTKFNTLGFKVSEILPHFEIQLEIEHDNMKDGYYDFNIEGDYTEMEVIMRIVKRNKCRPMTRRD